MHIVDYKNWNKRKIAIFNDENGKKSNISGLFNMINFPSITFDPNDENLIYSWNKEKDNIYGIILTGSSYDLGDIMYPVIPHDLIESGIPILGICYGHQYLMSYLGADLISCNAPIGDYGVSIVKIEDNPLFTGLNNDQFLVEMRHHLMVDPNTFPEDCEIIASTKTTPIAGFYNAEKNWWGLQFHPEKNYLYNIIFNNFIKKCYEDL